MKTRTLTRLRRPKPIGNESEALVRAHDAYFHQEHAYYGQWSDHGWFWGLFSLLFLGALVALIVVAATQPAPQSRYWTDAKTALRDHPKECTVGETFDAALELCGPVTRTPLPVLPELVDTRVPICDSFFHRECGLWAANHTNENRAFGYVYRKNARQAHDIIRSPESGPIYRFYRSCVDTLVHGQFEHETRAQQAHVTEQIVGAFETHADLPVLWARLAKYGFTSPFSVTIEPHPTKPTMVPLIRYDNFPDALLEDTELQHALLSQYMSPARLLIDSERVLNMVRQFSTWHVEREQDGTFEQYVQSAAFAQDMTSMGAVMDMSGPDGADFWRLYLRELNGVGGSLVREATSLEQAARTDAWMLDRPYFVQLFRHARDFSVEDWKLYAKFSILYHTHQFVPELPSDSYFRVHTALGPHREHRLARRAPEQPITDVECLSLTHRLLPGLIAREFLHRDVPHYERVRAQVLEVTRNIRAAFSDLINQTSWMSERTRRASMDKIRSIRVRALHPNVWETEPFATRITMDRWLRNLNMVRRYRVQRNIELWSLAQGANGTLDRDAIQRFGAPLTTGKSLI